MSAGREAPLPPGCAFSTSTESRRAAADVFRQTQADAEVSLCITEGSKQERELPTEQLNNQTSLGPALRELMHSGNNQRALAIPCQNMGLSHYQKFCPVMGTAGTNLQHRLLASPPGQQFCPILQKKGLWHPPELFMRKASLSSGCGIGLQSVLASSRKTPHEQHEAPHLVFVDCVAFLLVLQC